MTQRCPSITLRLRLDLTIYPILEAGHLPLVLMFHSDKIHENEEIYRMGYGCNDDDSLS